MTPDERKLKKAEMMAQMVASAFQGKAEKMDAPMSKTTVTNFLNNIDQIVEEILKRSKL